MKIDDRQLHCRPAEPLRAHTINEVRYYLMVNPCRLCGKGPQEIVSGADEIRPGTPATVGARCKHCRQLQSINVLCQNAPADADAINPTAEPSRIVDLGQWLSLFYLLLESAAAEKSRTATRRGGYQAMLCLSEALKFYGDNELPPEEAFFAEATAAIFRRHPEKFARQKLRDMQSKLPAPAKMAARVAGDQLRRKRRWWQFWNR